MRLLMLSVMLLIALPQPSHTHAAEEDRPTISGAGGAAGIGQYPPNAWGVSATTIRNPTKQDQQLLVTFNFEDSPTLQFAVDVWIPAGTRRSVWIPIRTNAFEINELRTKTLPLRQQLIDPRGNQPVVLDEAQGLLTATRDRWITGMLADGDDGDDDAISTALALRRAVEFSPRMAYMSEQGLPTMVAGWEGLNALVISKNSPEIDSAQIQALRQWLLSGGKLWVMLDEVTPQSMAMLLGETWSLEVVDRVPLSTVKVDSLTTTSAPVTRVTIDDDRVIALDGRKIVTLPADEDARLKSLESLKKAMQKKFDDQDGDGDTQVAIRITGGVAGDVVTDLVDAIRSAGGNDAVIERDHERPVDLVRVLARDFEVTHSIDGWPAALRKPVGKGWLMVTTLGARGWVEPRLLPQTNVDGTEAMSDKGKRMMMNGHVALRPLRDLADWFHQDRRVEALPPQAFDAFLGEQIGYSIVSRGTVMWVLMLFSFSLLGVGFWLSRSGRLEHLAWIGAIIAIVVTLVLIIIGKANQSSVPMTVAQAQFVQVAPDQQQAITSGLLTIYNPSSGGEGADTSGKSGDGESNATLEAQAGGLILPDDLSRLVTRRVRMVWTDFDRWHWQNVSLPSGANTRSTFEHVTPLSRPVSVTMTFDELGAVGRVMSGELGAMSNMLIATPCGALAVQGNADGSFTARSADALAAGQYISAGVLDDAQRRRQEVLRILLGDSREQTKDSAKPKSANSSAAAVVAGRSRRHPFPEAPTLIGWADAVELGFVLPKAKQTLGTSLVSIPIHIERPAAGTAVTLPSAFLSYRVARGQYGPTPAVYVEDQRTWNASSVPGTLPLAFRVPAALLPLRVEKASFTLDITAPNANVEILVDHGGKLASVKVLQSPSGATAIDLPAGDAQPGPSGEIIVVFRVNYINAADRTLWQLNDARLEVKGVVESATR